MEVDILKELYPIRNCEFEINDNGLLVVFYINKKPSFIERIFFKKLSKKPYKIDLDEVGSFIYQICDGSITTDGIIQKAKDHFGGKIEPAEDRVIKFIEQLNKNKLITLYEKR